jgi:hypothetical protein
MAATMEALRLEVLTHFLIALVCEVTDEHGL